MEMFLRSKSDVQYVVFFLPQGATLCMGNIITLHG